MQDITDENANYTPLNENENSDEIPQTEESKEHADETGKFHSLVKRENAKAVLSNDLILHSKCDKMSLVQIKTLYLVISNIRYEDQSFTPYCCNIYDLAAMVGIDKGNIFKSIKDLGSELLHKRIFVAAKKKNQSQEYDWIAYNWFSVAQYDADTKQLSLQLNDKLEPFLLNLKKLFTPIDLVAILALPSERSIRLFQLLCYYKNLLNAGFKFQRITDEPIAPKKEVEVSIDEMKLYLNYNDSSVKANNEFVRNYLTKAVSAVVDKGLMRVTFRQIVRKNKIVSIVFKFPSSEEESAEELKARMEILLEQPQQSQES